MLGLGRMPGDHLPAASSRRPVSTLPTRLVSAASYTLAMTQVRIVPSEWYRGDCPSLASTLAFNLATSAARAYGYNYTHGQCPGYNYSQGITILTVSVLIPSRAGRLGEGLKMAAASSPSARKSDHSVFHKAGFSRSKGFTPPASFPFAACACWNLDMARHTCS